MKDTTNTPTPSGLPQAHGKRSHAVRWIICGVLAFPTAIALFYAVENFRGARAWNLYRAETQARGAVLDFAAVIPPPIPDSENGAMTPWVQSWFPKPRGGADPNWPELKTRAEARISHRKTDEHRHLIDLVAWKEALEAQQTGAAKKSPKIAERDRESTERAGAAPDVLQALTVYQPALDELREASKKPKIRYPIDYKLDAPFAILLPHLSKMRAITSVLGLQCSAKLALNKTDEAFSDVLLMFWLTESLRDEPFLINQMVRVSCLQTTAQAIWEGLNQQRWNEGQLAEFQSRLAKMDYISSLVHSLDAERGAGLISIEQMRKPNGIAQLLGPGLGEISPSDQAVLRFMPWLAPRGWFRFEAVNYCRALDAQVIDAIDVQKRKINKDQLHINTTSEEEQLKQATGLWLQHKIAAKLLLPAMGNAARKFTMGQVVADEAELACALERYRLAKGKLPETLPALVPQYLVKIPQDVLTGESLNYQRISDTEFSLRSIGWSRDELEEKNRQFRGAPSAENADWVWRN